MQSRCWKTSETPAFVLFLNCRVWESFTTPAIDILNLFFFDNVPPQPTWPQATQLLGPNKAGVIYPSFFIFIVSAQTQRHNWWRPRLTSSPTAFFVLTFSCSSNRLFTRIQNRSLVWWIPQPTTYSDSAHFILQSISKSVLLWWNVLTLWA